jgi:hypothetical protein
MKSKAAGGIYSVMPNDVFSLKNDLRIEFEGQSGAFIVSVSTLDGPATLSGSSTVSWQDLLCETISVNINRGIPIQLGYMSDLEPGTAEVQLTTIGYDPLANNFLHVGTPARISVRRQPDTAPTTWTTLFTGQVKAFDVSYNAQGLNLITLSLVDDLEAFLNQILPTYIISGAPKYWYDLVSNLVTNYYTPGSSNLSITGTSLFPNYNITSPVSIGDLMNELMDGELGFAWVGRQYGTLNTYSREDIRSLQGTGYIYQFSTVHDDLDPDHVCITGLEIGARNDEIANEILFTLASNTALTELNSNPDAIDLYGSVKLEATLNLYDQTQLAQVAQFIVLNNNLRRVKSISTNTIKRDGTLAKFISNDLLMDKVGVYYNLNGVLIDEEYIVTRVSDYIDGDTWETTLELWRGY